MIFDRLDHLSFYLPQNKLLSIVNSFMKEQKFVHLEAGSHWLVEPDLRVIKEPSLGKGYEKGVLEAHRAHIDIQISLSGCDRIGYRPTAECTHPQAPFDFNRDIQFFDNTPLFWIDLPPGYFCMLFPQDAHAPLSCNEAVEKLIFKLRVDN